MDMLILANTSSFCNNTKDFWSFVGSMLNIFRIVVPLLVIIFGMIDLGKAVVGSKDEDIKKAAKQLLLRAIAGVCIFFVPSLVIGVFDMLGNSVPDYKDCAECLKGNC